MTTTGRILYAYDQGVYVIKLIGDVRLNLSMAFDRFQEQVAEVSNPPPKGIFIDLTNAEGLDSTTLGLLAKMSLNTQSKYGWMPTIISDHEDINRILFSMGFDQLFVLLNQPLSEAQINAGELSELDQGSDSEEQLRERVIDAHKVLMEISEENQDKFKDLVKMLEAGKYP